MDEEMRRLERATRSDPSDVEAARRFDQALQRAGDREGLRRRYRARLLCPLRFEELTPTADPLRRRCDRCQRNVRFVRSEAELAGRLAAAACVACPRRDVDRALSAAMAEPRLHTALDRWGARLHATDLPFVDLDRHEVDVATWWSVPREVAEHFCVFPVALVVDAVFVALGDPSAEELLPDLRRELELEVRPVLAERGAIERAIPRLPFRAGPMMCGMFADLRPPPTRALLRVVPRPPRRNGPVAEEA